MTRKSIRRWSAQMISHLVVHRGNCGLGREPRARIRDGSVQYRSRVMTDYGRSAVSISSRANGALGERRRHESDGMKLEIVPPGCLSSVRRSTEPTFGSSGSGAHSRAAGRC